MATNKNTPNTPAQRKRPEIVLTPSGQASVNEIVAGVWANIFTPVEDDTAATVKAYNEASDKLQKIFEGLRTMRDDSKPVQRERLDTEEVVKSSIGKTMSDLQQAYVTLDVADGVKERVNLPTVRRFSEMPKHPMHDAAVAFLNAHKVKFIEREGKGRGKNVSVLTAA